MEFHHIKENGRLALSPVQNELRERYIASLKDGTLVRETLTKTKTHKTHQQVKMIFGLVIARILAEFEERGWDSSVILGGDLPTGNPVTKGLLKEYFYVVCPIFDDDGNRITLSGASIEQANQFIDEISNHAAKWQIFIPEPDPKWRKKKADAPLFRG